MAANMCDVLENITNGSVELSGTAVGDTATYTCEEGYILQGNRRRVCQRDSSWTGFEPTCRSESSNQSLTINVLIKLVLFFYFC